MTSISHASPEMNALSNKIESIYPLAPMQEGLLFHTLMNPEQGMYLLQYRHVMEMESLNQTAFQRAWSAVVQRHELLRTAFVWKQQKRPLQVVYKEVDLPVELMDWRGVSEQAQQQKLDEMLAQERQAGLDFNKAPIMRVRLIQLDENRYQFVRSYHHILMDAWCFSLIMMDFLTYYRAFVKGEQVTLPKPRPYQDFIRWLREQPADTHKDFWQQRLAGFDVPTSLGIREPKQYLEADPVVDLIEHLSVDDTAKLQALAAQNKVTLNTLIQGAWALLLNRYSGEQDLLFGVTVAGRPAHMEGMESIVGLFINTLPLRWRVSPTASLGEWLRALQTENLALREHETSSLADIQQWSEVEGQDLFQSLFVFENAPMDAGLSQENLEFIVQNATNRTHTNYPITVVIIPGESLHLQLTYQGQDFSHDAVSIMLGHFKTLLLSMLTLDSKATLSQLPMLQAEEVEQQKLWSEGDKFDLGASYIERFDAQVAANPNKVVVSDGETTLTYEALSQRVNALTQKLVHHGVKLDSVVALLGERNSDFLVMILAVLRSGAAYLPLDPSHPPLRIAQVLKQSRSSLVLANKQFEELALDALSASALSVSALSESDLSESGLDGDKPSVATYDRAEWSTSYEAPAGYEASASSELAFDSAKAPDRKLAGQNLAYVIFTSGSTGTPKGAMVTRNGMLNNMLGKFAPLQLTDQDVIAQTASQCFDISVWQFLIAPILGARVEILPDCISQDPARLVTEIDRRGISVLEPVPALIQGMLATETSGSKSSLSTLRWVLPTGEALPPVLAQQWIEQYPSIPLMNAYGPAECSDDVAFYPIVDRLSDQVLHVPIGSATANNRLYLLSPELELVPIGAIGEIYVAGTGIGRGYLNEPERTAGVFLPNPFLNNGERLYRTGDLARYLADGSLQYVGRVDYQVKVRGYRIELGEIESRLAQHPDVDEVVLLAANDKKRGKVLVAYIAGEALNGAAKEQNEQNNWRELRDFVAQGLPDYMVPSAFVCLPKLPRNNNGKVDRKQLPSVDFNKQLGAGYVAPTSELQQSLCETWQSLLGLDRIGIHDNFFELGGHSLLATQMAGQLTRLLSREVPLRSIFEQPTIALLASWIDANEGQNTLPPLKSLQGNNTSSNQDVKVKLSWSQQRMWFLQQLDPESAAYNLPAAIRIHKTAEGKKLSVTVAEQALNSIISEHDILRTHFVVEQGEPVQVISPKGDISISVSHLETEDEALSESLSESAILEKALKADAMQPFSLDQGPLLRVSLYELEHSQVLAFNCHHIIADAWSLRLLVDQFCKIYQTIVNDQALALATPELQYSDYALWQRELMDEGHLESQLDYWKTLLQPKDSAQQSTSDEALALPVLSLSSDYPRPEQPSGEGKRYVTTLSASIAQKLTDFDRAAGRSHFASTMAAFQLLLGAYSGQKDILIGVPVANRHHALTQDIFGCFINTLVQRADLTPTQSVEKLIESIAKQAQQAQANQDLPFDYLIDQLGVDRQTSYNPLFQSMFNYLSGKALDQLELGGLEVDAIDNRPDTALCDFKLDVQAHEGTFNLSFEYSTELFQPETVIRMANDFERILEWMLENPESELTEMDLWQPADSEMLEAASIPKGKSVLSQFAEQVNNQPDAIGVQGGEAGSNPLTYAELNRHSDRLAVQLQKSGIKQGDRVALCVDRDQHMLVSILAVLKSGAAYVPIEPEWPADRMSYVLAHSTPVLCLVNRAYQSKVTEFQPELACLAIGADTWFDLDNTLESDLDSDTYNDHQVTTEQPLVYTEKSDTEKPDTEKPDQLAYILYTSGSTGRPKGVEISLGNLAYLCRELSDCVPLSTKDKVLSLTTYCFDISIVELLYPLTQGASILVATNEQTKDPRLLDQLLDAAVSHKPVSLMQATPATWSMFLARSRRTLDGVTAISIGEALSAELGRQILMRGAELINAYGPTEVTVYSTYQAITLADCDAATSSATLPIGKVFKGLSAHVLDDSMRSVPEGVTGELYLSGDGVGLGYHKAPDLTEKAFVANPYCSSPNRTAFAGHERFYKTGDLVSRRLDGTLDYLGRNDFQVKLRGFRIELGEIEALLPQLDGVDNAVVLLEGKGDQAKLVAYWSGEQGESTALREHLAKRLPEYMLPTFWQWLDVLPQNANGKVDRGALQALALPSLASAQAQTQERTAPQGLWEKRLACIWNQVLLGVTDKAADKIANKVADKAAERDSEHIDIAREDNFFSLGGHSLLAARIVAALAEDFAVDVPLRSLFEKPTLMALAAEIEQLEQSTDDSQPFIIPSRKRTEASSGANLFPMHATQKRLWFLEKFSGASRAYQLTLSLRVKGKLNLTALQRALAVLMSEQNSLRTVFVEQDGDLYQAVLAGTESRPLAVPLSVHSLDSSLFEQANETLLVDTLRDLSNQAFTPEEKPPWRLDVLEAEQGEEHILQLCLHHLIADAWSLKVFFDELQALYSDSVADVLNIEGRESLPYQFGDYASWWQGSETRNTLQQQLNYWKEKLAGEQPLLDLPTDFPRPKQLSSKGQRYRFTLPENLVAQLKQQSSQRQVTAFVPLLNAWQLLLSRYSGQDDIQIGIPVANRQQAYSGKLIGYFASTQVVKAPLALQESVETSWQRLQQTLTEAQQNQDLPFEKLVEALDLPRDNGRAPLFQSLFNLIQLDSDSHFAGLATERITLDEGTSLSEIGMQIEQGQNEQGKSEWCCVLEYSSELFLQDTMARYARHYLNLLTDMLSEPEKPLCQVEILSGLDGNLDEKLEQTFNDTSAELKDDYDLIRRFESQVESTPEAIAIRFHDESMSYRRLNSEVNQLAHYLMDKGVGAEQKVAILLDRGPLAVIAHLAVLKAGGAYIPLDPAQPADRLSYICQHAKPSLLITQTENSGLVKSNADVLTLNSLPSESGLAFNLALNHDWNLNPSRGIHYSQLAYVIYTSGSTGKPKGVAISRGNLANFLHGMGQKIAISETDSWLAVTTTSFDISALEIYLPLLQGATLLMADSQQTMDVDALFELLNQATVFQATPTTWQMLLTKNDAVWPALKGIVGGEAVPNYLAKKLMEKGVTLINAYGPTETTIWSTTHSFNEKGAVEASDVEEGALEESAVEEGAVEKGISEDGVAAIGTPILNNRCYLLDDHLQPVPLGATGELYIAGEGVARGYQDAPDLTASVFVPDPFSQDGSRLYKTGDLVRLGKNGLLEYIGRSDFQIKVRGFRIELGEIENSLRKFEGVSEAVVVADDKQRLVAFLQTQESISSLTMRELLEAELPAYMLPYQCVCVSQFALNSNGKIDRKALTCQASALELQTSSDRVQSRALEGDVEHRLADIWQALLGTLPKAEDSFFVLGGHSLLAMQMIAKVEAEFGIRLALQSLFEKPTIAALAEQITGSDEQQDDELDFMDQLLSEFED
ncbi:non-ribosomal peptide synthetase [Marinomonas sp. MED121]|uniref:non-ribosomal peptide synthetase n=1 Tax=Marinomonas sp. MED121 TaxID=314277 RepID=UPI0002FD5AEB|nr:non-ribosomal peptide synthetase [Marinomonas sp. MED121]